MQKIKKKFARLSLHVVPERYALTLKPDQSAAELAPSLPTPYDASIYIALERLLGQGFVTRRSGDVVSRDGKTRTIGYYSITQAGREAHTIHVRWPPGMNESLALSIVTPAGDVVPVELD